MLSDSIHAVYLGRPWRAYAMTVFMNCQLPKGIRAIGWDNWKNAANEKTARYMEYNNTGEGADTSGRIWSKVLNATQADEYTLENVLGGYDHWNPAK